MDYKHRVPGSWPWPGEAPAHLDLDFHSWLEVLWDVDGVSLPPRESQGVCRLPRQVLQGDHAHSDQVTAVNALVALRQHGLDSLRTKRGFGHSRGFPQIHTDSAKGFLSQNFSDCCILCKYEVMVYTESYPLAIDNTEVSAK